MKSILHPHLVTGFLLVAAILIFPGVHWGWLDDVLFEQNFRGLFTGVPIADTFEYHEGFGALFVLLYRQFPGIPWYNLTMFCLGGVSVLLFFHHAGNLLLKAEISLPIRLLFLLAFHLVFFTENLAFPTFTRISLMGMGAGFFSLLVLQREGKSPGQHPFSYVLPLLLIWAAYLIRFKLFLIPALIFAVGWALLSGFRPASLKNRVTLCALVLIVPLLHLSLRSAFASPDRLRFEQTWDLAWTSLDASSMDADSVNAMLLKPEDSIRFIAARDWFFQDEEMMGAPFLSRLKRNAPIWEHAASKWNAEVEKSKHFYREERTVFNWFIKSLILILFIHLFFPLVLLFRKERKTAIYSLVLNGFAMLLLAGITLVAKMEDRVLQPALILLFFSQLALISLSTKKNGPEWKIALSFLIIFGMFRLPDLASASSIREQETRQSKVLMKEIDSLFSNKLLFADYYARTFFHGSAFENALRNSKNRYLAMPGERASYEFSPYRIILSSVCEFQRFISIWDCLAGKQEKPLFLMAKFRADMLNAYFRILYHRTFVLEELPEQPLGILKSRYSFAWFPFEIRLYSLRNTEGNL